MRNTLQKMHIDNFVHLASRTKTNISNHAPDVHTKTYCTVQQLIVVLAPGDVITKDAGFMRGHGTYMKNGTLYASVAGVIQRVNKLISVTPLKTKYQGEIGDVIVGKYNLFITCQEPILNSECLSIMLCFSTRQYTFLIEIKTDPKMSI